MSKRQHTTHTPIRYTRETAAPRTRRRLRSSLLIIYYIIVPRLRTIAIYYPVTGYSCWADAAANPAAHVYFVRIHTRAYYYNLRGELRCYKQWAVYAFEDEVAERYEWRVFPFVASTIYFKYINIDPATGRRKNELVPLNDPVWNRPLFVPRKCCVFSIIVLRTSYYHCNADKPEICATRILYIFCLDRFHFFYSVLHNIMMDTIYIYTYIIQMKHGRHMLWCIYILFETQHTQRWPRREANLTKKRTNK